MTTSKKVLITIILAALTGGILSTWFSPGAIAWYFDPPTDIGVNCRSAVEWSLEKFQLAQLAGLGAGAFLGMIIAIFLVSRQKKTTAIKSV